MANQKRLDPRVKRTRALLRDALISLIVERNDYKSITVTDVTTCADVSRTTFYLHFKDIDELLFDTMRDMYIDIVEQHYSNKQTIIEAGAADYEHIAQFAPFYRIMLGEHGSAAFRLRVETFLAQETQNYIERFYNVRPEDARLPMEFIVHYIAGGEMALMRWWIQNDMCYPPAEMSRMSWELSTRGVAWALGAEPEDLLD